MKTQAFDRRVHLSARLAAGPLTGLLAMILFFAPTTDLAAQFQQDPRQLNREQTQQSTRAPERRIALVIGNGTYTNAPPLKNPPNDARDMAATLKMLGFNVTSGININQREMKRLIREFGQKLKTGGSGLFYYAGHGVQSNGRNYLIPVEADIQSEAEVEDSSVDVNLVLKYMDDAQNGLNIVILDACRNNPFARSFRSASNGLAQVDAPTGTLIAYATAPGRVASDGTGENGLYTSELLKQVRVPGLSATEMFMRVRAEVMKQTSNKQVPWEASSLVGTFYFTAPTSNSMTSANLGASTTDRPTPISDAAREEALWAAVQDSSDPQDFKNYLASYPNGAYAPAAEVRLRRLEAGKNTAAASMKASTKVMVKAFGVELQSCKMSAGDVVCEFMLTNISAEDKEFNLCHDDYRVVRRGKDVTIATDNGGNRYALRESVIGGTRAGKGLFGKAVLPPQVPVRMTLKFANVVKVSIFSLLRIAIYERGTGNPDFMIYADFKNVAIEQ